MDADWAPKLSKNYSVVVQIQRGCMEAGYDYLLLRRNPIRQWLLPLLLVTMGITALAGAGSYYTYAHFATESLPEMATFVSESKPRINPIINEKSFTPPQTTDNNDPKSIITHITSNDVSDHSVNVGDALNISSWLDPRKYQPLDVVTSEAISGFTPVGPLTKFPLGSQLPVKRMLIPNLGIDSSVAPVFLSNTAINLEYKVPDKSIGHLSNTANAGEHGSAWYFGHLESPLLNKGSVFSNLPKIADMIRNGEDVFVITDNGQSEFLYRITSTKVVKADELVIHDSGMASIHLVTCIPRLVYDHRLIASGELVGYK